MTDGTTRAPRRRPWLLAVAVLLVALVAVLGLLTNRGQDAAAPPGTASSAEATTTPPPFPQAPYARVDDATLTVPERTRFGQGTFWATAGTEYLVTMDLESTKPEGSGGRSMYLGVTLSCTPQAGGPGISAGGTQNMLTGETTTYSNQGLISVPEDGAIDCSIKASAPYDQVASNGTTFDIEATWRAAPVGGEAQASDEEGLPRTVAAGAEETVMSTDLPLDGDGGEDLQALSSLHLTTCTIVNGSREDGRAWCSPDALDEDGSTVTTTLRADLVDERGAVCRNLGTQTGRADHIDLYRHHRLLSQELEALVPEAPCGTTVRLTAAVRNEGPAPVVVHRSNSSLLGASDAR